MRLALLVVMIGACGGGPSAPGPGGPGDDDSPPSPDGGSGGAGTMSFDWKIQVGAGVGTCSDVGAVEVEIISTKLSDGTETVRRFPCASSGTGTTNPLPPGGYTNRVSLLDGSNFSITSQSTDVTTITPGDNTIIDLVTFRF